MRSYNTKDWFPLIFQLHRSDTFRKLWPLMLGIGVYSAALEWLEVEYWQIAKDNYIRNINIMHAMLGFVLSMLLVFRTNTAYERWWEGRKLWGALVNNSRNLALKLNAMLGDEADKAFFRKAIPDYATVLQAHLKDNDTAQQLFDGLDLEIDHHKHRPNQLAAQLFERVNGLHRNGIISGDQLIVLNTELLSFTDICGACERIKNTPIPYSYSAFIKKFIVIYVLTLPFGYAFSLGYYVPLLSFSSSMC